MPAAAAALAIWSAWLVVCGLIPLSLAARGLPLAQIAGITAVYPGVWGLTQVLTGLLSDRVGRKWLIVAGMWVQALGIFLLVVGHRTYLLGLARGSGSARPGDRGGVSYATGGCFRRGAPILGASAVGVYRLWRDSGYVVGAITAGIVADKLGIPAAIAVIGALTFASGAVVASVMSETLNAALGARPRRVSASDISTTL